MTLVCVVPLVFGVGFGSDNIAVAVAVDVRCRCEVTPVMAVVSFVACVVSEGSAEVAFSVGNSVEACSV